MTHRKKLNFGWNIFWYWKYFFIFELRMIFCRCLSNQKWPWKIRTHPSPSHHLPRLSREQPTPRGPSLCSSGQYCLNVLKPLLCNASSMSGPLLMYRNGCADTVGIIIICTARVSWSKRSPGDAWSGWMKTPWWGWASFTRSTGSSSGERSPSWGCDPPSCTWGTRRGDWLTTWPTWLETPSTRAGQNASMTCLVHQNSGLQSMTHWSHAESACLAV